MGHFARHHQKHSEFAFACVYTNLCALAWGSGLFCALICVVRGNSGKREIDARTSCWACVVCGHCVLRGGLVFDSGVKAGFITGLYLVFHATAITRCFALVRRATTSGLAIAIGGFVVLSFTAGAIYINLGDFLVLLAAVGWAAHVAATSAFASQRCPRASRISGHYGWRRWPIWRFSCCGCWVGKTPPILDLRFAWQIG